MSNNFQSGWSFIHEVKPLAFFISSPLPLSAPHPTLSDLTVQLKLNWPLTGTKIIGFHYCFNSYFVESKGC